MGNETMNNQNQKSKQVQVAKAPLTVTALGDELKPSVVMFRLKTSLIEKFVESYLVRKGVSDQVIPIVSVRNEGADSRIRVDACIIFKKTASVFFSRQQAHVNPMLRGKMNNSTVKVSDDFKKILAPLTGHDSNVELVENDGDVYIKLSIERILGLLLLAEKGMHDIGIAEAVRMPNENDGIVIAFKKERFVGNASSKANRYYANVHKFATRNY